jgi:hypothetical protein
MARAKKGSKRRGREEARRMKEFNPGSSGTVTGRFSGTKPNSEVFDRFPKPDTNPIIQGGKITYGSGG